MICNIEKECVVYNKVRGHMGIFGSELTSNSSDTILVKASWQTQKETLSGKIVTEICFTVTIKFILRKL